MIYKESGAIPMVFQTLQGLLRSLMQGRVGKLSVSGFLHSSNCIPQGLIPLAECIGVRLDFKTLPVEFEHLVNAFDPGLCPTLEGFIPIFYAHEVPSDVAPAKGDQDLLTLLQIAGVADEAAGDWAIRNS